MEKNVFFIVTYLYENVFVKKQQYILLTKCWIKISMEKNAQTMIGYVCK